jgi:dienelactone hydrolase
MNKSAPFGARVTAFIRRILSLVLLIHASGQLLLAAGVVAPPPTGPYRVGTLSLQMEDTRRTDPIARNGSHRKLMVRFWYPTVVTGECQFAEYSSPKVWSYLSSITGIPQIQVGTNSCKNSIVALGKHPVIIATHGYTGMFTDYTFLFEELASQGYVVASVAHTYESTAVEFPDGRLIASVFGSHFLPDSARMDNGSLELARLVRLQDLQFVTSELQRLNRASGGPFSQRLDLERVGIMGHSLGGETALASLEELPSPKAAAILDPVISQSSTRGTAKPVLLLAEGRQSWSTRECRLWNNLSGIRIAVNFAGAGHLTPSDAIWLGGYVPELSVETGSISPAQTVAALRRYLTSFFDSYLAGKPRTSLLNGVSKEYANVSVITSRQSLCENNSGILARQTNF